MGQLNQQDYDQSLLLKGEQSELPDLSLVVDELTLATSTALSQPTSDAKPGSHTVRLFWDEALITATALLYGQKTYPLKEIDSLQILKLHRKRSVIQKKLSNFLAGILTTAGIILLLSPLPGLVRLLALLLILASVGYVAYFNWWIEQRRRGEFGLLITTTSHANVVITSPNLKAVQTLYKAVFGRLDNHHCASESLVVNMYTGETTRE